MRWVADEPFPGLVEAHLVGADGVVHVFVDKVPIFTAGDELHAGAPYPIGMELECAVGASADPLRVELTFPGYGLESLAGDSEFLIEADALIWS